MKTTTYIIAGLAVCGAVGSGVSAAILAHESRDLPPITFVAEQTTLTLPRATAIVMVENAEQLENIRVGHVSEFTLTIEESDSVSAPQLTMSETWAGMITPELRGDTLYITADYHSLKEHFASLDKKDRAIVFLKPTDMTLTLPHGMTRSLKADSNVTYINLTQFDADSLEIVTNMDLTITDSHFGHLSLSTPTDTQSTYRYRRDVAIRNVECGSTTFDLTYRNYNLSGPARLGDVTINTTGIHNPDSDIEIPEIILGSSLTYNDLKMTGNAMCLISLPMRPGEQVKRTN